VEFCEPAGLMKEGREQAPAMNKIAIREKNMFLSFIFTPFRDSYTAAYIKNKAGGDLNFTRFAFSDRPGMDNIQL
jgi:hypothetical protein